MYIDYTFQANVKHSSRRLPALVSRSLENADTEKVGTGTGRASTGMGNNSAKKKHCLYWKILLMKKTHKNCFFQCKYLPGDFGRLFN